MDTKLRVGILRGGVEGNYNSSLKYGGEVISHILENLRDRWKPVDILLDKSGVWHVGGVEVDPSVLHTRVDLVWNAASPTLANVLRHLVVPHISTPIFSQVWENHHIVLEKHLADLDLKMPRKVLLPLYQRDFDGGSIADYALRKAKEIHSKFGAPWIVKSYTHDSDMAIHVARTFGELAGAIEDGVHHGKSILVEELITGASATTHSVFGFRGEEIYVFPVLNISIVYRTKLRETVRDLHKHLGTHPYLRSDFVIHPKRGVFVTGLNFSPDLKPDSALHSACESVGAKLHQVVEHILDRAV